MFQLDGCSICLIDTPGFNDTELSDEELLKRISAFLSSAYESGHKLTGIIYLHRIKDERMTGIDVRNFKMFRKLCGADSLCSVALVTNMWADPPIEEQLSRKIELREDYFKQAIDQGATLVRRPRKDTESAHGIIRMVLQKNPIVMQIQHELVDKKQNVSDTGAGQVLGADLAEVKNRYEKEMVEIREELRVALEEKDTQRELEMKEALRQATANSERVAQEIEALRLGVDEERARWERRIDEANRDRREAEKQREELRAQMEELRRLAESARETDKAWYEEQIRGLYRFAKVLFASAEKFVISLIPPFERIGCTTTVWGSVGTEDFKK
ncbi:hypothetical protein RhiJN_20939 [Ceratobasidium sp. AG-Ba]|nr:hypothetical protein RhiJN_20939 [Ceratobasidium sp. AG-Ba]